MTVSIVGSTPQNIQALDYRYPVPAQERSLTPSDHELMVYTTMAKQAVASKMYRGVGEEAGVMMVMLAAREMGIPPMSALNGGLNIIQGKIEIAARMMSAMIRRAGHSITIKESTDTSCTLVGRRRDTNDTASVSYTLEEAQKAGLVKSGGGWVKNPKDMCFARAISRLARQLFSDVIGVGYVEGEIRGAVCEAVPFEDSPSGEQEVPDQSEDDMLEALLDIFDAEERNYVVEYVDTVQKHFGWARKQTLQELLGDKQKTIQRFNTWKNKKAT